MKHVMLILLCMWFATFSVSAQIIEKAEGISPLLIGETIPDAELKAPDKYSGMLSEKSDGLNDGFLPVPSIFVTDTSGKIAFEYINPDYKTRLSPGLLLAVLKELKLNN